MKTAIVTAAIRGTQQVNELKELDLSTVIRQCKFLVLGLEPTIKGFTLAKVKEAFNVTGGEVEVLKQLQAIQA